MHMLCVAVVVRVEIPFLMTHIDSIITDDKLEVASPQKYNNNKKKTLGNNYPFRIAVLSAD